MFCNLRYGLVFCGSIFFFFVSLTLCQSQTLEWTRQLGTSADEITAGASADGLGNVYLSGYTGGSLGGTNAGGDDAFVAKYDGAGNLQWTRQLGTSAYDGSFGVSADGLGNVYLSAITGDYFPNEDRNAFLAKFTAVPEPATLALLLFAVVGLLLIPRRRLRPAGRILHIPLVFFAPLRLCVRLSFQFEKLSLLL